MKEAGTLGLVLAGGAGRRMGGRDKAWLRWCERPLVCHVLDRFAPQVDTAAVSSNRHRWAYRRLGIESIPDRPGWQGRGPLAAIATVLSELAPARLAIVPVDAPHAPRDHVARLSAVLDGGARAAAVHDGLRRQPLFAVLRGDLVETAVAAMRSEPMPSMQDWLDDVGVVWIDMSSHRSAFLNINTSDDLEALNAVADPCVRG